MYLAVVNGHLHIVNRLLVFEGIRAYVESVVKISVKYKYDEISYALACAYPGGVDEVMVKGNRSVIESVVRGKELAEARDARPSDEELESVATSATTPLPSDAAVGGSGAPRFAYRACKLK